MKRELLALVFLVAGCGKSASSNSDVSAQWHDNRGYDITVLQSWIGGGVGLAIGTPPIGNINPSYCNEISNSSSTSPNHGTIVRRVVDCSSALEDDQKLPGTSTTSPLISPAEHVYDSYLNTGGKYTQNGRCEMLEFRTIIRDVALTAGSFNGIGFYLDGYMKNHQPHAFVPKSRLHPVGHVTLKDGSPATVHRFIAQGMCFGLGGNGGTISDRQYKFRPFAEYKAIENGEEHFYRQWDSVPTEYLLGRNRQASGYVFVRDFDRQDELLQK